MATDELLTVEEVARYLRVHEITVQRWCRAGTLPAAKIGRAYRIKKADWRKPSTLGAPTHLEAAIALQAVVHEAMKSTGYWHIGKAIAQLEVPNIRDQTAGGLRLPKAATVRTDEGRATSIPDGQAWPKSAKCLDEGRDGTQLHPG
jgi:excisionase family DNA binding protein